MLDGTIRTPEKMALFLDVDGTLIDFAPEPQAVQVPTDLPAILGAVHDRLDGALALISGRAIADLDRLFAPLRLPASGLHGGEFRADPQQPARPAAQLPHYISGDIRQLVAGLSGVAVEDKGASIAVHYRAAPAHATTLHEILSRYAAGIAEPTLDLMAGELVFELKAAGFDKGTALARFMQHPPFAGRRPVFIADHPIDEAAFHAASANGGMGISVGRPLQGAAGWFSDTMAVRSWLRDIA